MLSSVNTLCVSYEERLHDFQKEHPMTIVTGQSSSPTWNSRSCDNSDYAKSNSHWHTLQTFLLTSHFTFPHLTAPKTTLSHIRPLTHKGMSSQSHSDLGSTRVRFIRNWFRLFEMHNRCGTAGQTKELQPTAFMDAGVEPYSILISSEHLNLE